MKMIDYETCHKECTAVFMSDGECIFKKLCMAAQLPIERDDEDNE